MSVLIKNLISYPYDETTKTEGGYTFTDNGDGSVTVSGTNTTDGAEEFYFARALELPAGEYVLSTDGGAVNNCRIIYAGSSFVELPLGDETVHVTLEQAETVEVLINVFADAVDNLTLTPYIQEYNTAYKLANIAENEPKVYEAGKDAAMQRYWDIRQDYGKLKDYRSMFGNETEETFSPRYDIRPADMERMFYCNQRMPLDLVAHLEKLGVVLDTSNCTNMNSAFGFTQFTRLGVIDFRKCGNKTQGTFSDSQGIRTIELIIVSDDGTQTFSGTYNYLRKLVEIRFQGAMGRSVSFQHSVVLSVASMKDIIAHLVNHAGTSNAGKYTLTLPAECWERLEADSTAPDGGTWQNYVKNLGWLV